MGYSEGFTEADFTIATSVTGVTAIIALVLFILNLVGTTRYIPRYRRLKLFFKKTPDVTVAEVLAQKQITTRQTDLIHGTFDVVMRDDPDFPSIAQELQAKALQRMGVDM